MKSENDGLSASQRYYRRHRNKRLADALLKRRLNPEKYRAIWKKSDDKHREKRRLRDRERVRRLWATSPEWREKIKLRKRAAYQSNMAHREARKAANRKWARSAKGRHFYRMREHFSKQAEVSPFTFKQWCSVLEKQHHRCAICTIEFSESQKPERDHIFPRILGGLLVDGNVQALCRSCNAIKGSKCDIFVT